MGGGAGNKPDCRDIAGCALPHLSLIWSRLPKRVCSTSDPCAQCVRKATLGVVTKACARRAIDSEGLLKTPAPMCHDAITAWRQMLSPQHVAGQLVVRVQSTSVLFVRTGGAKLCAMLVGSCRGKKVVSAAAFRLRMCSGEVFDIAAAVTCNVFLRTNARRCRHHAIIVEQQRASKRGVVNMLEIAWVWLTCVFGACANAARLYALLAMCVIGAAC